MAQCCNDNHVLMYYHHSCRANERLGSGQFGTVFKGVWQSSPDSPPLDVAIKTLQQSAREEDRVKFLQEGAIMGQFRHLNIVKLHGIVREEKTVCCIIFRLRLATWLSQSNFRCYW